MSTNGIAGVGIVDRPPGRLVRRTVPARSPLAQLASAIDQGLGPTFFWQDEDGATIGLGELDRVEAAGPDRLRIIDANLREWAQHHPELQRSRWYGGFSYEPYVSGAFASFGAARFVRPRFVWHLERGAPTAILEAPDPRSWVELEPVLSWANAQNEAPEPLSAGTADVDGGDFEAWALAMKRAHSAFRNDGVRKVVLSRDVVLRRSSGFSPARVLAGLPARSSAEVSFACFAGEADCFLGLTPERLIRIKESSLSTEALAGSSAADDPDGFGLLESVKDLEEHRYVVDYLRERIARFAQSVEVSEQPVVRRLGNIAHLCTPIEARGHSIMPSVLAVADALHPSPAVGGAPLEAAQSVIEQAENRPRGWYTGAVGWIQAHATGAHQGDLRVALRSALIRGAEARVFVGAGIVPASTTEGEWRETALKSVRTVAALGGR